MDCEQLVRVFSEGEEQEIRAFCVDGEQDICVGREYIHVTEATSYNRLTDKPKINGVELVGDKTSEELGIEGDKNYVHSQTTASDVWVIQHNLNKYPAVTVIDSADDEVVGEIQYDSVNQVTIRFAAAFKGKATFN